MSLFTEITFKWNGNDYKLSNLLESNSINDLKNELYKLTNVMPERQKLLGLKTNAGQPVTNETLLIDLKYKSGTKIMMMGTCEEKIKDINEIPENIPEIIDDFDIGKNADEIELHNKEENLAKINRRVKEYKINILNDPRPNKVSVLFHITGLLFSYPSSKAESIHLQQQKKLLVLDIDYTIFDHVSHAERGVELMRPFLHEFLTSAYQEYDIAIWSATSLKWIEVKMNEIGVSRHPDYKIVFYVDCGAMISVYAPDYGLLNVKPLKVLWDKFPEFYSSKNTIMFDDLRRNFLMNPQNGLRIEPYKNAHTNRDKDQELLKLTIYLKKISKLNDLSELKHKHWYKY